MLNIITNNRCQMKINDLFSFNYECSMSFLVRKKQIIAQLIIKFTVVDLSPHIQFVSLHISLELN